MASDTAEHTQRTPWQGCPRMPRESNESLCAHARAHAHAHTHTPCVNVRRGPICHARAANNPGRPSAGGWSANRGVSMATVGTPAAWAGARWRLSEKRPHCVPPPPRQGPECQRAVSRPRYRDAEKHEAEGPSARGGVHPTPCICANPQQYTVECVDEKIIPKCISSPSKQLRREGPHSGAPSAHTRARTLIAGEHWKPVTRLPVQMVR